MSVDMWQEKGCVVALLVSRMVLGPAARAAANMQPLVDAAGEA
eukprot:SAG31_NODE_763_length_12265_cov_3.024984_12_plen_43_part_00